MKFKSARINLFFFVAVGTIKLSSTLEEYQVTLMTDTNQVTSSIRVASIDVKKDSHYYDSSTENSIPSLQLDNDDDYTGCLRNIDIIS